MNKLDELLADKRKLLIVGVGLVLLLMVGIILQSLLTPGDDPLPPGGIDQQFNFDSGAKINIDNGATIPDNVNKNDYYVYDILQTNHSEQVQQFMVKIGKGFWTKQQYNDLYYIWQKSSSDNLYLVDYDTIQDRVFFRFEQPVVMDLIHNGGFLSIDMLEGYFTELTSEYFGIDAIYRNFDITRSGENYRVEANRDVGGTPVRTAGSNEYTDYVLIEEDGDLIEGQIYLFELGEGMDVTLMEPNLLGSVINRNDYPKDINELAPIGLDLTKSGSEPYEPAPGFLGDAPPNDEILEIPSPNSCEVRSIEVVYYYIRTTTKKLGPAYKLDCRGTIDYKGQEYTVPMIIYANALDPELVYIPGNL